ncbi:hypothetical protein R3I93_012750 [Phoxinus phoxinus]|uniref:Uncharacterized protein n=1 Tax=Phoxinus phoxinus TaxID=58324 RepID=A0AAN9CU86_9TELE
MSTFMLASDSSMLKEVCLVSV